MNKSLFGAKVKSEMTAALTDAIYLVLEITPSLIQVIQSSVIDRDWN